MYEPRAPPNVTYQPQLFNPQNFLSSNQQQQQAPTQYSSTTTTIGNRSIYTGVPTSGFQTSQGGGYLQQSAFARTAINPYSSQQPQQTQPYSNSTGIYGGYTSGNGQQQSYSSQSGIVNGVSLQQRPASARSVPSNDTRRMDNTLQPNSYMQPPPPQNYPNVEINNNTSQFSSKFMNVPSSNHLLSHNSSNELPITRNTQPSAASQPVVNSGLVQNFQQAKLVRPTQKFDAPTQRSVSAPRGRPNDANNVSDFRSDRRKNQSILSTSILNTTRAGKEEVTAIEKSALSSKPPATYDSDKMKQLVSSEYQRGMIFYDKAQYDQALERFKESLSLFFKSQVEDVEMLADIYLGMGIAYQALGDDSAALELYGKCIETLESKFGKHYPGIVSALVNSGIIFSNQKNFTEALKTFMRAQKLAENVLGSQRIALADIYHNIGVIYDEQSRLNDALTFYDKSLRIREKIVGTDHPIVAMGYENMAQIFKDQGEFKKAYELQTKVINIRKKHLGTNSIDYALALHNLGIIYFKEKKYENATTEFSKAYKLRSQLFGEDHEVTRCSQQLYEESDRRATEKKKKVTSMSGLYSSSFSTSRIQ